MYGEISVLKRMATPLGSVTIFSQLSQQVSTAYTMKQMSPFVYWTLLAHCVCRQGCV